MASSKAASVVKKTVVEPAPEEQIRLLAYRKWQDATGGQPVDQEATDRFWEEARLEIEDGGPSK